MFAMSINLQAQNQDRILDLANRLDSLATNIPGLNERTTLSLRDVPLHEYVRAVGMEHKVNVYIADRPDQTITNNLVNEPVKSVFLFVCQTFNYDIQATGTILRFVPYKEPIPKKEIIPQKPLNITYKNGELSLDLKNDSLFRVIRQISVLTGQKLIATSGANREVSVFVPPSDVETVLDLLAKANDFQLKRNRKGYYILRDVSSLLTDEEKPAGSQDFTVEAFSDADVDFISIDAEDADLKALLKEIFLQSGADYFIFGKVDGQISVSLEAARIDDILKYLFQGTSYTYLKKEGLYLIGEKGLEGLETIEIVKMKFRPTYQALDLIPGGSASQSSRTNTGNRNVNQNQINNNRSNTLQNNRQTGVNNLNGQNFNNNPYNNNSVYGGSIGGASRMPGGMFGEMQASKMTVGEVEIIEYPELNRIILKGPTDQVKELSLFLQEIDRPIPMVKVEMIVVEANKNYNLSTGIRAGLGNPGDSAVKSIAPGIDYQLNGKEINDILSSSQIPFLRNLGALSPDFYLQLKAQEAVGNVKIRMTPVLSMLNGREASLVIGQTQYFLLETTTAATGAVNNFQTFTQQFAQIEANISLSIRPFISDDNMVTLDLFPDFSTPIGSLSPDVPPTIATRRFDSSIRVKDGETFVLGGLTRDEKSQSTSGLPVLSRIPIIKWLVGTNNRTNAESSLIIYITPTIYYH